MGTMTGEDHHEHKNTKSQIGSFKDFATIFRFLSTVENIHSDNILIVFNVFKPFYLVIHF